MTYTYPKLVYQLSAVVDAWIVGSGADPDKIAPKDFDLVVSPRDWHIAALLIPKDATVNSFGGWKCNSEGVMVDVWPEELNHFLTSNLAAGYALHFRSGVRLKIGR